MKKCCFFASAIPEKLEQDMTLPSRFMRLLARLPTINVVRNETVAIKMHVGGGVGYSTIHPLFVKNTCGSCSEWKAPPCVYNRC